MACLLMQGFQHVAPSAPMMAADAQGNDRAAAGAHARAKWRRCADWGSAGGHSRRRAAFDLQSDEVQHSERDVFFRNRKAAIALLLERTPEQDREELAVLEAARGVEAQRRAEAAARRAAAPPGTYGRCRVAQV